MVPQLSLKLYLQYLTPAYKIYQQQQQHTKVYPKKDIKHI